MSKTKFPSWFTYYSPPYPPSKPCEYYDTRKQISSESIHEDIILEETDDTITIVQLDYSGCLYESDQPTLIKVTYQKIRQPNTRFEVELRRYEKALEVYNERSKDWKVLKKIWDKDQKLQQEEREVKYLESLAKKHGKKLTDK